MNTQGSYQHGFIDGQRDAMIYGAAHACRYLHSGTDSDYGRGHVDGYEAYVSQRERRRPPKKISVAKDASRDQGATQ